MTFFRRHVVAAVLVCGMGTMVLPARPWSGTGARQGGAGARQGGAGCEAGCRNVLLCTLTGGSSQPSPACPGLLSTCCLPRPAPPRTLPRQPLQIPR